MAEVPLLRIDERLIHGQVVAGFLRSLSCNAVFLNDLENAGVDIIFQVLAEKKATSWEKIKAKQFPNLV